MSNNLQCKVSARPTYAKPSLPLRAHLNIRGFGSCLNY